jgi:hypothetical protein
MGTRIAALLLTTALATGCLGSFNHNALQGPEDGGVDGVDGAADVPTEAALRQEFSTDIAPIIAGADGKTGACGACHGVPGAVGTPFLVGADMLTTMLAFPSLIGDAPETSRLLTKGLHEGPAFPPSQVPPIAAWIIRWAAFGPKPMGMTPGGGPEPSKPVIVPFAPQIGAGLINTVDLAVLTAELAGQSITFEASLSGTNLILSKLEVKTASMMGIRIVHPLFVVWDDKLNPKPDPVDSFSNLDQTVAAGATASLGPGLLVLPNFGTGYKLSVVFTTAEPKMAGGAGDGGTVITGCKSVQTFLAVRTILAGQCYACHTNGSGGLTMSGGLSDAQLCNNVRGEIDTATPASSRLLIYPNPQVNNVHTGGNRKFPQGTYDNFAQAVNNWINAEK